MRKKLGDIICISTKLFIQKLSEIDHKQFREKIYHNLGNERVKLHMETGRIVTYSEYDFSLSKVTQWSSEASAASVFAGYLKQTKQ